MKLYKILEEQLKKELNYVTDDGELKKWVVLNKAQNFDEELIGLLLDNAELKEAFFVSVKGVLVFNQNRFVQFLEQKNYFNDSYTLYKNKVGLTIDGKYLKQRNEVSLVWPFKDCVLEGGQSREEDKREEIFFNEILAQDEITRLFEAKVLTHAKRIGVDGEMELDAFRRGEDGGIRDNLIIKGNNLLALHSLKKEFWGRVKLIYIDPPFNTRNDSFGYNDNFNHSTWLTFMKNRLEIAKAYLSDDGSIWIHIDENESHYLKILCDDIFGMDNFIIQTVVQRGAATGHKAINPGPVQVSDILLTYAKNKANWKYKPVYQARSFDGAYKQFISNYDEPYEKWVFCSLKEGLKKLGVSLDECMKKFPERIIRFAQPDYNGVGSETKKCIDISKNEPTKIFLQKRIGYSDMYFYGGNRILFYKDKLKVIDGNLVTAEIATNIWTDMNYQGISKEGGITLKKGKKPELLIKRMLEMCTENEDLVMDFFAGGGTLGAAAHKMGRQYVLIEQLDYIHELPEKRLKNVINGDPTGISKTVNWQGGGDFVYLELKKYNQAFIEQIQEASDTAALLQIWELMKAKSFLNYNVDIKKQEEHIEEFKALSLKDQKRHLCELLNKNHLYVNRPSLNDTYFECSEDEKRVTKDFYRMDAEG